MADFEGWDMDGVGGNSAGQGDTAGGGTPQIRGGLLDPSTFPSPWPPVDGPQITPASDGAPEDGWIERSIPLLKHGLDSDTHAEVLQDILKAQAKLPPLQAPNVGTGLRHIDPYPGMNRTPPGGYPVPGAQAFHDFLGGAPLPEDAFGPHITFINDEKGNPSPDRPVTKATASMVEQAVVDSGVKSVNINSTTGGQHDQGSRHPLKMAVDIDMTDERPVSSANAASRRLQDAAARQPNIRENFGPSYQTKTYPPRRAKPWPQVRERHDNHDHFSGQE